MRLDTFSTKFAQRFKLKELFTIACDSTAVIFEDFTTIIYFTWTIFDASEVTGNLHLVGFIIITILELSIISLTDLWEFIDIDHDMTHQWDRCIQYQCINHIFSAQNSWQLGAKIGPDQGGNNFSAFHEC